MTYEFTMPKEGVIGANALNNCIEDLKSFGKKALIVTGKNVTKIGTVKILTDVLDSINVDYEIYNDIVLEPTDEMIIKGVDIFKKTNCNYCIAIGGGSPLDSGKAIVAMTVLKGKLSDYMGKTIQGDFPPLISIPTTAGTGSETTKFTIITDTSSNVKMLLKGEDLLPKLAIIDYNLTISAPKGVTAATGIDALTHAVEAYTSRKANSLTDTFALSAIRRIFKYLPLAYINGEDKIARKEMSIAAFEAGVCINNSSVTIVHGMSRPIGAIFHVPHGMSNAMLIKECLSYVLDGCYEKFANIAREIQVCSLDDNDIKASKAFIEALGVLLKTCEIPTLESYGIEKEEFENVIEKMAEDAINSGSPSNTIKDVHKDDLIKIYKSVIAKTQN